MTGKLTLLLRAAAAGNEESANQFALEVHRELEVISRSLLRTEAVASRRMTDQDLVDEFWLRVIKPRVFPFELNDSKHFYRLAKQVMSRVLTDDARRRNAEKRGAGTQPESLDDVVDVAHPNWAAGVTEVLIDVYGALREYVAVDPDAAAMFELELSGCSAAEIAQQTASSPAIVEATLVVARAWLVARLGATVA